MYDHTRHRLVGAAHIAARGTRLLALCLLPWQAAIAAPAEAVPQQPLAIASPWQDEHGASVQLSQWRGRTVLLTMAYSSCREVCSYALHRLEELQRSADHAAVAIEVVVISYDPAVDSPGTWSIYRRHHHLTRTNWHFLTGSAAATSQFADAMQFPYWRYDEHLLHDFQILVIGSDGRVARTLTWATRNDDPFTTAAASCSSSDTRGC